MIGVITPLFAADMWASYDAPTFGYEPTDSTDWDDTDTALAAWTAAVLIADRNQTRQIADKGYAEKNRWMGESPSDSRIDKHFAATAIVVGVLSYVLPQKTRRLFLTAFNVAETVTVMHNYRIGLGVNF